MREDVFYFRWIERFPRSGKNLPDLINGNPTGALGIKNTKDSHYFILDVDVSRMSIHNVEECVQADAFPTNIGCDVGEFFWSRIQTNRTQGLFKHRYGNDSVFVFIESTEHDLAAADFTRREH
jgi:hypothetical protein